MKCPALHRRGRGLWTPLTLIDIVHALKRRELRAFFRDLDQVSAKALSCEGDGRVLASVASIDTPCRAAQGEAAHLKTRLGGRMDDGRYRISAQHKNPRAYRQFYGRDSRTEGFERPAARNRLWRAFTYAQAFFQRKPASRF